MKVERTPDKGWGRATYLTWGRLYISWTKYDENTMLTVMWT